MKETPLPSALRELIRERQLAGTEDYTRRDLKVEVLPKKVSICMGVRRCGKSALMESRIRELRQQGVPAENIVYLNFMDDRLAALEGGDWNALYDAYYGLYPDKRQKEKVYFFFDEMQDYPHWQLFVERLRREENCDIYLTGSSSKLLSKEIASCLRGRTMSWELFPFSFREYLRHVQLPESSHNLSTTQRLAVQQAWEQYTQNGGFPECFGLNTAQRRKLHQEYFSSILYHDVVERNAVSQPLVLRSLARRLLNQVSTLLSVSKLSKDFASMGYKVSRETISQYIQWLEDAYFIITVPACSPGIGEQQRRLKKLYCIDHALASSLGIGITENRGQMLENMVCVELRRHTQEIYYYTTKEKYEVDFLAAFPSGHRCLVQVCADMSADTTRKRELRALSSAMQETAIREAVIVTEEQEENVETPHGTIRCIPARRFFTDALQEMYER